MPIELKTRAQIVNQHCIERCRELLAQAESGDIESIFVIAFRKDGDYDVLISETMDMLKKIGCLERLKHEFLNGA